MLLGRQVFQSMGIDPDNYLCLNIATTGVRSPIGVLEVAGRYGGEPESFQHFISPDNILIPADLNYPYTRIPRYKYDDEVMDPGDFVDKFLSEMRESDPEIVLVNNAWWFGKLQKEGPNASLHPFFSAVARKPLFSIVYYETARAACDYTLFTPIFETYFDMSDHIKRLHKQAPREFMCDVDCAYDVRGGEEVDGREITKSQENVDKMVYIWENILNNNEAQEVYNQV